MEFKSQICTTREQSERLVAMGLKPETADMMWDAITVIRGKPVQEPMWSLRPYYYPKKSSILYEDEEQVFIPAWSMSRLMEMAESDIQSDGSTYVSLPAVDYWNDSKYYLEKEDMRTAFGCIEYSHGLLDALRMIHGII